MVGHHLFRCSQRGSQIYHGWFWLPGVTPTTHLCQDAGTHSFASDVLPHGDGVYHAIWPGGGLDVIATISEN